jgi:hypothetical protein
VYGNGRAQIDGTWARVYGKRRVLAQRTLSGARMQRLNESWVHYDDEGQTPQMDYGVTLPGHCGGGADEKRDSQSGRKWGLRQRP